MKYIRLKTNKKYINVIYNTNKIINKNIVKKIINKN